MGRKIPSQEISAKSGQGIDELLEKVLLEAELLNLKANPERRATGSTIEASLDKGRGYVATVMVQTGTLRIGDIMLAGAHYGRVKAMFDDTGKKVNSAGPSTPVQVLGLDSAPQAGEKFQVMESDREAREVANKRGQIIREQSIRTKKHITLDEIGKTTGHRVIQAIECNCKRRCGWIGGSPCQVSYRREHRRDPHPGAICQTGILPGTKEGPPEANSAMA